MKEPKSLKWLENINSFEDKNFEEGQYNKWNNSFSLNKYILAQSIEEAANNEEAKNEQEVEIKPQEGLIKRFSAKALFGSSVKKQNEISSNKEELLSDITENKHDHIIKEKDELSLETDISLKSVDKNNTEDTLDIPAFLRRQKE